MKRFVIVGASSGLGQRIAYDFARRGLQVGLAARREEPLRRLQLQFPDNVVYEPIDITQPDATERFLRLIELNGGMDTLVMASGVGFQNPDLDLEKEMNIVRTNVEGYTRILTAAYRYFRDTRNDSPGQIAAITSVASTKGIGIAAAYSASKRYQREYLLALEQLSRRQQVAIDFTEIRPGFVDTPLIAGDRRYPMTMALEDAARMAEKAILTRRRVEVIDCRWMLLTALWGLIPDRLWGRLAVIG